MNFTKAELAILLCGLEYTLEATDKATTQIIMLNLANKLRNQFNQTTKESN